jgi:FSR family fosmidomycin resistance protein-like MFS transporter
MGKANHSFWMGIAIIWISHLFMDFMLGVWPIYKTIAQVDLTIAGLIAGLGIFIGDGLQVLFGYLSDKGYQQRLLAVGIGLAASIPFVSYVENEWLLFVLVVCAFIGSGAFHPAGSGIVMAGNSSSKSFLISLFACGGMIGAASSQIVYTFLYYNFAGQIWFLSIPILLCALGCAFFPFPRAEQSKTQINFKQNIEKLKPEKTKLILLYIVHVLLQIVVISFTFLLPDILMIKGYQEWFCLGGGYLCFIMGSVLTSIPIVGYGVDKIGYRLVLVAIIITSAISLYVFLAVETLSLTVPILLLGLLGGTMGVFIPVVVAGGTQNVPASMRSFVSALYMGGTTCVGGLGPILVSLLASFFGKQTPVIALQGAGLLLIFSLGFIYYLPDPLLVPNQESQAVKLAPSLNGEIK